jgi:outer membrane receptor protein involved in Fe transport
MLAIAVILAMSGGQPATAATSEDQELDDLLALEPGKRSSEPQSGQGDAPASGGQPLEGASASEASAPAESTGSAETADLATIPVVPISAPAPVAPAPRQASEIEEIIVTAQKRSESINSVPLSIQAFSGDTLKQLGITDTRDLQAVVPGFTFADSGNNTPVYTLRGVGFNDTTYNATPTVGIYVDEISLPYSIMSKGPDTDLERIEVLKGPQGLLYGRNSTGGAINFITNKPGGQLEGGLSGTYGRFATADVEGFISGPITDTIGGRVAARHIRSTEGYQTSHTRPEDTLGELDKLSWRGMLNWDASEALAFALTVSGWDDHSDATAAQAMFLSPSPIAPVQMPHERVADYPYFSADATDNRSADWDPHTDWKLNDSFWYAAMRADWQAADDTNLVMLLNHGAVRSDGSKVPQSGIDVYNAEVDITAKIAFTALETRIDGIAFDDSVQWMVGANGAEDETDIDYFILMDTGTAQSPWGPPTEQSPYGVAFLGNRGAGFSYGDSQSYGVFGNVDVNLGEEFRTHVGARYTQDSRSNSACIYETLDSEGTLGFAAPINVLSAQRRAQAGLPPAPPASKGDCLTIVEDEEYVTERSEDKGNGRPDLLWRDELKERNLAYKAGLDWVPDFGLIYASYTRGYKSGSYPLLAATSSSSFLPARQERLDAYEIGAKIGFLGRALQTNAALFYYDYKDKQLLVRTPDPLFGPLPVIRNAPKSRVMGADLSVSWQATEGLYLSLAGSYVDTKVQGFTGYGFVSGEATDFAGSSFNFSPKVQINGLVNYTTPLGNDLYLVLGASWSRTGETNSTLEGDSRFRHPQYDLFGATTALHTIDGHWRVTAFGRNLTDELGVVSIFQTGDVIARRVAPPRTYGLTLAYNYF